MERRLRFQPYSNAEVKTALEVGEQEDFISSLIPDFGKVNVSSEPISSEDAAWIDSCFIGNSKLGGLDLQKYAIRHMVDSEFVSSSSHPTHENDNFLARRDGKSQIKEPEATEAVAGGDFEGLQGQDEIQNDLMSTFLSLDDIESVEGIAQGSIEDLESPDNIFHVWDLETHFEEDEFSKELNRAIAEKASSFASPEIDDLIASMADLSFDTLAD